jgi:uncharacterized membrane protein YbhN (UPF0104 family)
MKKFFYNLLSGSSETSSKRFASLIALFVVISLAYIATYKDEKHITPEFMFDSIALIAGGGLGLTVIENIAKFKHQAKNNTPNTGDNPPIDSDNTL